MSRALSLDLFYMHEMAAGTTAAVVAPGASRDVASDLTARLRCLKALMDAERAAPCAEPGRRRVH